MKLRKEARYRMEWDHFPDSGDDELDLSLGPVPRIDMVTQEVVALMLKVEDQAKTIESLRKDLADIRNRRSWETLETSTDPRTGMIVTVRTVWSWKQEAMQVMSTPEAMMYGRYA